ncbi:MAG: amidohydrolase family protein, partial [Gemmatimonadaceae bacterium]
MLTGLCLAALAVSVAPASAQDTASNAPAAVERGTFRLFKLQQRVGAEEYEIAAEGESLVVRVRSALSFLGGDVPLEATLRTTVDLEPLSLTIKGATSTMTDVDASVRVAGDSATVRERSASRRVRVPERFFVISHYPPVSLQQQLLRYWASHGKPDRLPILPVGEVTIVHLGRDTVQAEGRSVLLDRYGVGGVIWGRQTLWLDGDLRLIAAVGGDAELDRFEAIREGYEEGMPLFVARSVSDGLSMLERASRAVRPLHEGRFAIVGGRLIDGTGAAPVEDATLVIENGRITAAGPRARVSLPRGISVYDAGGLTILPGLWDMHGHYEQVEWAPAGLAAGVTTVRDAANEFELITALRDALDSGRVLGPRLLPAGVIDGGEHPLGVITADTPDEARAAVSRYARAGFPQIKIYGSLKPELVKAIADEAHRLGMTVTGHVPNGMNAIEFVQAGADQINHLNFVIATMRAPAPEGQAPRPLDLASEEARRAIQFFRERGTVLDPSLARGEQHRHPRDRPFAEYEPGAAKAPVELRSALNSVGVTADLAERAAAGLARSLEIVGVLHDAGIPIVLGTDLVVPGHSIHRELELAVRAGLTPMEAIQAATIVPARAMDRERETGTVEAGKRADLLIVEANPLENISNTRRVRVVV